MPSYSFSSTSTRLVRLGCTVGAALGITLGSALAAPPEPSPFAFYERYIAIDDASAFPSLHRLPNGDLTALIWPLNVHGRTEGSAEAWVSRDHGVRWSRAGVPVPADPGVSRLNVAAGVFEGAIIALVGGFGYSRPPYEEQARFWTRDKLAAISAANKTIPAGVAISKDSGFTWTRQADLTQTGRAGGIGFLIPYGRIEALPDGTLGAMLYGEGVYFYVSRNRGETWQLKGTLDGPTPGLAYSAQYNETTWITLSNGDLYAAARSFPKKELHGGTSLDGFRSVDGGATWTKEQALALPNQIPADLMHLPDGNLLLTYSSRNAGSRAIWFRIGSPDARGWSAPTLLVDLGGSAETQYASDPRYKDMDFAPDGGYPSTVLAADGTFVTVYYVRGVPAHQRYHMGVVRWRLKDGATGAYTR